jgi:hypothetical protein
VRSWAANAAAAGGGPAASICAIRERTAATGGVKGWDTSGDAVGG